jgi:AcrR family transcriptional regulator
MELTRHQHQRTRTRNLLVFAARELVQERGYENISIQDVTRRAEVGTGTFYNYFQTKQQVFEAVLSDFRHCFAQEVNSIRANLKDPATIVAVTLKYYFCQAQDNERWKTFITYSGLPGEHVLHQDEEQCLSDIQRGVQAGRFKVDDVYFTQSLVTGMVKHTNLEISRGNLGRSAMDDTAQYVLRMLGLPYRVARALAQSPLPLPQPQEQDRRSARQVTR